MTFVDFKDTALFGVSLFDVLNRKSEEDNGIPSAIKNMIEFLSESGSRFLSTFSHYFQLFHAKKFSSILDLKVTLKALYNKSMLVTEILYFSHCFLGEVVEFSYFDPYFVADLLKEYLSSLPEPLLTNRLYADFMDAAGKFST